MQWMWLCILSGRRFGESFENAQWRKIKQMKQMQPMWPCIFADRQFSEIFGNTRYRKVKLKCHVESVESFEKSNIIYCKGYPDVNLRRWHYYRLCDRVGDKINCVAVLTLKMPCDIFLKTKYISIRTNKFFNLDQYTSTFALFYLFPGFFFSLSKNTLWKSNSELDHSRKKNSDFFATFFLKLWESVKLGSVKVSKSENLWRFWACLPSH